MPRNSSDFYSISHFQPLPSLQFHLKVGYLVLLQPLTNHCEILLCKLQLTEFMLHHDGDIRVWWQHDSRCTRRRRSLSRHCCWLVVVINVSVLETCCQEQIECIHHHHRRFHGIQHTNTDTPTPKFYKPVCSSSISVSGNETFHFSRPGLLRSGWMTVKDGARRSGYDGDVDRMNNGQLVKKLTKYDNSAKCCLIFVVKA